MQTGKILTLLGLLLFSCTLSIAAQVDTDQSSMSISSEKENQININLDPTAGVIDFEELDSLIKQLDTTINNLNPASNIYGHGFFMADSLKVFMPGDIVKVPDSYALGAGDEIAVAIFGLSQMDAILEVNDAGFVSLGTDLPRVNVKGMPWGAVKDLLRKRYSNFYRFQAQQFAASVVKPRSLSVNVIGEVEQPGTYLLEATNTAWHALVAAGGPTHIGSIRNIKVLTSAGKKRLDIYKLLNDPSIQDDFYLEDNATISVAPLGDVVSINGAVLRPMKYELYNSESIEDLLGYSGGLRANAVQDVVQIRRYSNDRQELIDLNLREQQAQRRSFPLQHGDDIMISSIPDVTSDVVYIEGAVNLEGTYDIGSTPRVSDLVAKARLKREAQMDQALLMRLKPDSTFQLIEIALDEAIRDVTGGANLALQDQDRLIINDLRTYVDRSEISVSGAVRKEIKYPFDINADVTLAQAIQLAGGLDPEAQSLGYVLRSDPNNRAKKRYVEVNIREALSNAASAQNLSLSPWDEVMVLRSSDLTSEANITSRGAFRSPDELVFHKNMSVKELILLSGGLSITASGLLDVYRNNLNGEISVISLKVNEDYEILEGGEDFRFMADDEVVAQIRENYEETAFVEIQGEIATPGFYAITQDNENVSSIVKKAGGLTNEALLSGAYILRLDPTKEDEDEEMRYRVPLHPVNTVIAANDIIRIPGKRNSVKVTLSHTRGSSIGGSSLEVPYHSGKSALWYIEQYAGGLIDKKDRDAIVVEHANGAMERSVKKLFKHVYPVPKEGATIHVIKSNRFDSSSKEDQSLYPKLKEGVIINVNPNTGEVIRQEEP